MTRSCEHEFRAATWSITEHNPAGSLKFACPHDGCDGVEVFDLLVTRRMTYFPRTPMFRYTPLDDSKFSASKRDGGESSEDTERGENQ